MAYTVGTRMRELSIRMALGAQRRDVLLLVMKDGMKLILIGLGLGLVLALGSSRLLTSQLYGVTAGDPVGPAGAIAILCAVAAFACWWPALRATRASALRALRAE